MYKGTIHSGLAAPVATVDSPRPGEPPVPHLRIGVITEDGKRSQAGLPNDVFEKAFALLPPAMTGANEWQRKPLAYVGRYGSTFDIFTASIPLTTPEAQRAAASIGVAFGLDLNGETYWLQSSKTNLAAGPSNVRGLAGVRGADTPSGGNVVVRQDRTKDPGKSTLHFEVQDNAAVHAAGSKVELKVAISSAKRFLDGKVTEPETHHAIVPLTLIGPNRYAGSVDFTHDSANTANPDTSYSREIERLSALPISPGVEDGEGDGVTLISVN